MPHLVAILQLLYKCSVRLEVHSDSTGHDYGAGAGMDCERQMEVEDAWQEGRGVDQVD